MSKLEDKRYRIYTYLIYVELDILDSKEKSEKIFRRRIYKGKGNVPVSTFSVDHARLHSFPFSMDTLCARISLARIDLRQ